MMRRDLGRLILAGVALIAVSFTAWGEDAVGAHVRTGRSLLTSGNFRKAEAEFQAALHLNPQSATTYVLLGVTENDLDDYPQAISAFHSALKLDPDSLPAHYNLALSLLRLRRDDQAIRELGTVVHLNPQFEPALYNLGLLLQRDGRFQESIRYLESAKAQRPNDPAVVVHLVEAYFRTGKKEKAILLAKQAVSEDSKGDLSSRLGVLLVDQSEYSEAVQALEKGRRFAPRSDFLAVYLAKAYLGTNQAPRAIELLRQFREGRLSWEAYDLLGVAEQAAGQPIPASKAFHQAILLKPDYAHAHFDLGMLLLDRPDEPSQQAGVQEIERAIQLEPHQTDYYEALGQWLLAKHHLLPAIGLLERGIKNAPPTAQLYLMLAVAKIQIQGSPAARPLIDKALAMNPEDGPAVHLLGKCYYLTGNYPEAARYFEKATRLSPQDGFFFYDTAVALERANRVDEAISYAKESVRLDPGQAIYHYVLGKLYAKTDQRAQAVKELETCVRLNPNIASPYYLLARTYMRMGNPREAQLWSQKLQKVQEANDRPAHDTRVTALAK